MMTRDPRHERRWEIALIGVLVVGTACRDAATGSPSLRAVAEFAGVVPTDAGTWMMHCHILEHAEAGMMTTIAVRDPT